MTRGVRGKNGAQKNAKRADGAKVAAAAITAANKPKRPRGKGKPFEPGNQWRIKPGEVRNPGGRPAGLRRAYAAVLAMNVPAHLIGAPSENGEESETARSVASYLAQVPVDDPAQRERPVSYAELIAITTADAAATGDPDARREIRQTTEAARVQSQEIDDIIEALKDGTLTPDDITEVLGDDNAKRLLLAAGFIPG